MLHDLTRIHASHARVVRTRARSARPACRACIPKGYKMKNLPCTWAPKPRKFFSVSNLRRFTPARKRQKPARNRLLPARFGGVPCTVCTASIF